ncbi:MAG TPA: META domain-containing protein, partial [Vicinamibacterales bacterium]|nr:META domain-containing protein [Vicinamibacterales bacterium]
RSLRVENRRVVADVVQAGAGDAMCCPGELASRRWELAGSSLRELPVSGPTSRLSLDAIGGTTWVLRSWDLEETAPVAPEITLQYTDGRFSGVSGCNNYFAAVKPGRAPGDVTVSPPAGTRKACAEDQMAIEQRFLQLIGHVQKHGFMLGQLALTYQDEGRFGVMLFERK